MKKVISLCLLVVLSLSLVGCFFGPAYKSEEKTFTADGISLTLTSAFVETDVAEEQGYLVTYVAWEASVFVLKESFSLAPGIESNSLSWYASLVRTANADKNPSAVANEDGLTIIEYTFYNEEEDKEYSYFTSMYKGTDAYWTVQFVCVTDKYEEYRPYFVTWAKSVNVITLSEE